MHTVEKARTLRKYLAVKREAERKAAITQERRESVLGQIVSEPNSYVGMFGSIGDELPERCQFVITGPSFCPGWKRVGYVVQVRVGRGQFRSDMYLIRHADGNITAHENNCYLRMTEDQVRRAREVFFILPEEELADNPDCTYRDCEKVEESGFIVRDSAAKPSPDTPFTVTVTGGDGSKEIHKFIP